MVFGGHSWSPQVRCSAPRSWRSSALGLLASGAWLRVARTPASQPSGARVTTSCRTFWLVVNELPAAWSAGRLSLGEWERCRPRGLLSWPSGAPRRAACSRKPDWGLAPRALGTQAPACALRLPRGWGTFPVSPRPLALPPLLPVTLCCSFIFSSGRGRWSDCHFHQSRNPSNTRGLWPSASAPVGRGGVSFWVSDLHSLGEGPLPPRKGRWFSL